MEKKERTNRRGFIAGERRRDTVTSLSSHKARDSSHPTDEI